MSYEEAKDQIALMHGHANWMVAEYREGRIHIDLMHKEAAELYAKAKWEESAEYMKREMLRVYQNHEIPGNCFQSLYNAPAPEFKP